LIGRLSALRLEGRLLLEETAGPVLAKIKDHSNEMEVQFQNN
jgi:hypothetical protein